MRPPALPADQRRALVEQIAPITCRRQRAEVIAAHAREIGISPPAIYRWLRQLLGRPVSTRQHGVSERGHDFRLVVTREHQLPSGNVEREGYLEQLVADGTWRRYPNNGFRELLGDPQAAAEVLARMSGRLRGPR